MKIADSIEIYSTASQESQKNLLYRFHIDLPLLLGLLLISAASLVILYSAGGQDSELISRQAIRLGIAFFVLFILAQISPYHIQRWTPWLFAAGLMLLFSVLFFGESGKGAQRWLDLVFFRFQPSELMKLVVPMMVAWYLSEQSLPPRLSRIAYSFLIVFVPVLLIAKQPDLGTSLLVGSAGIFVIFLAGISWRLIFIFCSLVAASAPLLWFTLHEYQKARVLTFINPENDPLGAGYHIIQSKIAIGSGGLIWKRLVERYSVPA